VLILLGGSCSSAKNGAFQPAGMADIGRTAEDEFPGNKDAVAHNTSKNIAL
jgi:hypothetical protein